MKSRSLAFALPLLVTSVASSQQAAPTQPPRSNPAVPAYATNSVLGPGTSAKAPRLAPSPFNLVLNGDFERQSAGGCAFGLSNSAFNAAVEDAFAFGSASELDVMSDSAGCGYGPPAPSGRTKLGVSSQNAGGPTDAFSLQLSRPLEVGRVYLVRLSSYAHVSSFSPDVVNLEVGVSSNALAFGSPITSVTPGANGFGTSLHFFTAASPATYLTIRNEATGDGWNHVDDVNLQLVDGPRTRASVASRSGLLVLGQSVRWSASPRVTDVIAVLPFRLSAPPELSLPTAPGGATVHGQVLWLDPLGARHRPGLPFTLSVP